MWWDAERIERTVTRQFVCSHLLPEEIERLDRPLAFGGGLTDGTYWEWIDEKAKRVFLILVDLGIPDQIFGVIDDSWDDDDLPIALDQVERLALTANKDEKTEKKFYYRQFHYLLKSLDKGEHVVYQEAEIVPLDVVDKRPGLTSSHAIDKVELPNLPGQVLCRRRIPLGAGPGCLSREDLMYEIDSIRNVQNEHLVSYWASYTHQGYGYVLFTPASDFSFKSFLATTPSSVKNLDKKVRRGLVMNWIHCLVDTLCFLHNRGLSHGNIRPSTVLFTNSNHIFFSDFTRLNPEIITSRASSFDKEAYDYAAPEQWFRPTTSSGLVHRKATLTSMSASPDITTFSISRGGPEYAPQSPQAMMHAPNPQLNPQAADIFSLGCIILELLGYLLKRQTRSFASHRAAKHKTPGRGGAVLDSSFHRNLSQVESWMTGLAKDAAKKRDDQVFRGVAPMLHVVERMLALHPGERPSAHDVQTRMYQILTDSAGITEPHCVHQYGGWDFGIGSLKLGGPAAGADTTAETMSIATKRSSGGRSLGDLGRRPGSIGSGMASRTSSVHHHYSYGGGSSSREAPQSPQSPQSPGGLQAVQNPRGRDKARPWQAPVYSEMSVG